MRGYVVRRSVPWDRGIQQVGDVRLFWGLDHQNMWYTTPCLSRRASCRSYCGRNQYHIITRKVHTNLYLSTSPIPYLYVHCKSQVCVSPPQIVTRRTNRGRTLDFKRSPSINPSRLFSLSSTKTRESRFPGPRKGCVSGRSRRKLRSPKKMR